MIISAIFKGQNGSLGYENGRQYDLKIQEHDGTAVTRLDGSGKCIYSSLSSFLRNWDSVKAKEVVASGV